MFQKFPFDLGKQRVVVITDKRVHEIYQSDIEKLFDCEWITVPHGERSKTRQVKESIENQLLSMGCKRDVIIIGLGGGVITDLAGFIASTYMRGVRYIAIPTTLMGMVDAAIGGKNGVNTIYGKNTIGTNYEPSYVHIDPIFLETLNEEEIRSGFMEVIKYGLIWDSDLLVTFETQYKNREFLLKCKAIKEAIVQQDRHDQNIRMILNFGHTMAHAIEKVSEYQISHGRALWFGLLFESYLSCELGYLSEKELGYIEEILERNLHMPILGIVDENSLIEAMMLDKKSKDGELAFVCLEKIGKVLTSDGKYIKNVDFEIVLQVLNEVSCKA